MADEDKKQQTWKDAIIFIVFFYILIGTIAYWYQQTPGIFKDDAKRNQITQKEKRCMQLGERKLRSDKKTIEKRSGEFFREGEYGYNQSLQVCGFYIKYSELKSTKVTVHERLENLFDEKIIATSTKPQNSKEKDEEFSFKKGVFLGKEDYSNIETWDQYLSRIKEIENN